MSNSVMAYSKDLQGIFCNPSQAFQPKRAIWSKVAKATFPGHISYGKWWLNFPNQYVGLFGWHNDFSYPAIQLYTAGNIECNQMTTSHLTLA